MEKKKTRTRDKREISKRGVEEIERERERERN